LGKFFFSSKSNIWNKRKLCDTVYTRQSPLKTIFWLKGLNPTPLFSRYDFLNKKFVRSLFEHSECSKISKVKFLKFWYLEAQKRSICETFPQWSLLKYNMMEKFQLHSFSLSRNGIFQHSKEVQFRQFRPKSECSKGDSTNFCSRDHFSETRWVVLKPFKPKVLFSNGFVWYKQYHI